MRTIFNFREGCHLGGDAQVVGEHLQAIRAARNALNPEVVLDDARTSASPLHSYFEWNDEKAAELHRLRQAGHIIRSVQVTYADVEAHAERQVNVKVTPASASQVHPVRAFVAVTREGVRGYEDTAVAMNDAELRRQVLERAHNEMTAVGRKYSELRELSEVFSALDRVGKILSVQGQPA